jgi:4-hydroxy-3-methylbut-2-enyl diphosphate reductase IspH
MYKRETKAIGRLFEVSMLKKFGPENLATHYAEFDTICDATQVSPDIYILSLSLSLSLSLCLSLESDTICDATQVNPDRYPNFNPNHNLKANPS